MQSWRKSIFARHWAKCPMSRPEAVRGYRIPSCAILAPAKAPGLAPRSRRLAPFLLFPMPSAGCGSDVMFPAGDVALQQRNLILISTGLMLDHHRAGPGADRAVRLAVPQGRRARPTIAKFRPFDAARARHLVVPAADHHLPWRADLVEHAPARPLPSARSDLGRAARSGQGPSRSMSRSSRWIGSGCSSCPEQGIATVNELALPVDVPVRFSMTSTSQMDTFYAPTHGGHDLHHAGHALDASRGSERSPSRPGAIRAITRAPVIRRCDSSCTGSTRPASIAGCRT